MTEVLKYGPRARQRKLSHEVGALVEEELCIGSTDNDIKSCNFILYQTLMA